MKTNPRLTLFMTLALAAIVAATTATAQEPPAPGPEHEILKRQEGEWTATIKTDQGETPATMSAKLECGGLWLVTDFKGEFFGMKFQGRGLDGYDPEKKKYVSVWVDSMSVRPMTFEGQYDKEKKIMTMTGEGPGPDGKPAKYKNVTRFTDADHQVFTMSIVGPDGAAVTMMTIEYARKK
jgi:hypothetical protein